MLILKGHCLEKHPNKVVLADIHQILINNKYAFLKEHISIVHLCVHRCVLVCYIRTKISIFTQNVGHFSQFSQL